VSSFHELLSQHVGAAFARQLAFADFLGDRNWSLTLSSGKVRFGDDLEYSIQLLGSEAHNNNTWLWAWANRHITPAPQSMAAANRLRQLGQEKGIEVFSEPSFSLDAADGHTIALVASGINGRCCYYRGPYDGGAAFFLVTGVPDALLAPVPPERAITVITEVVSQFNVHHRLMAKSFLASQGFTLREEPQSLVASSQQGQMTLSFDEHGRLTNIGGKIEPRPAASKRWWEFWKK
jgi:uncharacterized protein DUF6882